jgi:hypothetical protein
MGIVATKVGTGKDVYEIDYSDVDEDITGDTITAVFTNPTTGDKSSYTGVNDGRFVVTVDGGYTGEDEVTVTGSDGGTATGAVSFSA